MRPSRIPDVLSAAAFGAGRWLVIFGLALMLGVPVLRLVSSYAMRGKLEPSPLAAPESSASGKIPVSGARAGEAAAIHESLDGLALQFDHTGVRIRIVDDLAMCDDCAAAYLPEMREVLVPRGLVRLGGEQLRWALAHELGHHADSRFLNDRLRERYREIRGIPEELTWLSLDKPWRERPAEDFGEVFAVMVQPSVDRPLSSAYGRVRDPEAIEALYAEADLRTESAPRSPWAEAVSEQKTFLIEAMRDRARLLGLQLLALGAAVVGAARAALAAVEEGGHGPPATEAW